MARQYRGRFSFFYNYPNNDGLSFVFTENADISNTYIGLKYDKLGHTETVESHNSIAYPDDAITMGDACVIATRLLEKKVIISLNFLNFLL